MLITSYGPRVASTAASSASATFLPISSDAGETNHPCRSLVTDENDVFQEGEFCAPQFPRFGALELRHDVVEGSHVIGILERLDQEEGAGVGLVEDIFQFRRLVARVDRDEDSADLGRGELEDDPFRHVVGPDGNVVPLFDTELQEPLGYGTADLVELPVGVAETTFHVDERIVVGIGGGNVVEESAHGEIELIRHVSSSIFLWVILNMSLQKPPTPCLAQHGRPVRRSFV